MDNRPIGVFDSGVGGLTAVKELKKLMPNEDVIYFGDTARVPYGTRSVNTIKRYGKEDIEYLASFNVKAIVAACGTVSSNFTDQDYSALNIDIPFIRVINPAVHEAVRISNTGNIGVLATSASVNSGAYTRAIHELKPNFNVYPVACPLLIPLIENGLIDMSHPVTKAALNMYLNEFKSHNIDSIILGCTHFPLLSEGIKEIVGENVILTDAGGATIRHLKKILLANGLGAEENQRGSYQYHVTDSLEGFSSVAKIFLGTDITDNVKLVDINTIDKG